MSGHRVRGSDITVCIPTIPGREEMLTNALKSVAEQALQPADIVVVNDKEKRGAYAARNEAIDRVKTDWIAFLDDDDLFLPNHLEVLAREASRGDADLVYTYMIVDGGRDPLAVTVNMQWLSPFGVTFGQEQERHLRTFGNFIPITYLVKTEFCKRVGGFPPAESHQRPEDHLFLIKLLDAGARFNHVARRTWIYKIHSSNTGGGLTDPFDKRLAVE